MSILSLLFQKTDNI